MKCPLCHNSESSFFTVKSRPVRDYAQCPECDLIWMRPAQWLPRELEKERYDHHENDATEGYRQFLEPILNEIRTLQSKSPHPLQVLDYGCGPTAFFAKWLRDEGFQTSRYDLHYFTDQGSLQRPYDVIVSTEVWEHFHHPREEIEQLTRLLKPGGAFAIATAAPPELSRFHDWYYRRDLTHVVFYSHKTMRWICREWGLQLTRATSPYWVLQKLTAK